MSLQTNHSSRDFEVIHDIKYKLYCENQMKDVLI